MLTTAQVLSTVCAKQQTYANATLDISVIIILTYLLFSLHKYVDGLIDFTVVPLGIRRFTECSC